MANFKVNGEDKTLDIEPDMPLLWALRDELGMTGTKFGCGVAACGACTVHINGVAVRSCVTPVSSIEGQEITTIEGLASAAAGSNPSDPALTCGPAGMGRSSGAPMRLLPVRNDYGGVVSARAEPQS
jgi:aerobic-type carbon monoxide dehydrogenase small subunit (CoxS/CutS family)